MANILKVHEQNTIQQLAALGWSSSALPANSESTAKRCGVISEQRQNPPPFRPPAPVRRSQNPPLFRPPAPRPPLCPRWPVQSWSAQHSKLKLADPATANLIVWGSRQCSTSI